MKNQMIEIGLYDRLTNQLLELVKNTIPLTLEQEFTIEEGIEDILIEFRKLVNEVK